MSIFMTVSNVSESGVVYGVGMKSLSEGEDLDAEGWELVDLADVKHRSRLYQ